MVCSARFTQGSLLTGTTLQLDGGDKVSCGDGTSQLAMTGDGGELGTLGYTASGLTSDPSRTYVVSFMRGSGESFAGAATLPAPLVISSPAAGSNQKKGAALAVSWNAATSDGVMPLFASSSGETHSTLLSGYALDNGSYVYGASSTATLNGAGQGISGTIRA